MKHPWEAISLEDYENHMKLDSVRQLQGLNELIKGQLGDYPVSQVMILGIAGGNGLEHIRKGRFEKVYGVDVNGAYLEAAASRHPELEEALGKAMAEIGYLPAKDLERGLPNGKKLVRMDFRRA